MRIHLFLSETTKWNVFDSEGNRNRDFTMTHYTILTGILLLPRMVHLYICLVSRDRHAGVKDGLTLYHKALAQHGFSDNNVSVVSCGCHRQEKSAVS